MHWRVKDILLDRLVYEESDNVIIIPDRLVISKDSPLLYEETKRFLSDKLVTSKYSPLLYEGAKRFLPNRLVTSKYSPLVYKETKRLY